MKDWLLIEKTKDKERYRHRSIPGRFRLVIYQPNTVKKEIYQDGKLDDPEVTKQPSDADNCLNETAPNQNYGTLTYIMLGSYENLRRRGIDKFDFSADIPAGATINSATFSLYYYGNYVDPVGRTYWAYKLTRTDWTELGSTWNKYDGTNNWTTAGGDYVTSDPAGGSAVVPATFGWMNWDVQAIVQDAVDNVGRVAHFLIRDETEGAGANFISYFYSKEYTTDTSLRPKLYIDYTAEAPPAGQFLTPNKYW